MPISNNSTCRHRATTEAMGDRRGSMDYFDHLMPTEKQLKYLESLTAARGIGPGWRACFKYLTSGQVKQILDGLKPHVLVGRYAITGGEGNTEFYEVDEGKGKWSGMTFVAQLLGSRGEYKHNSLRGEQALRVLCQIECDGPENACRRFGRETRRCGICGSPLTDPDSIAIGIGPTCRKRFTESQVGTIESQAQASLDLGQSGR